MTSKVGSRFLDVSRFSRMLVFLASSLAKQLRLCRVSRFPREAKQSESEAVTSNSELNREPEYELEVSLFSRVSSSQVAPVAG